MSREIRTTANPPVVRPKGGVEVVNVGDVALVSVAGLIDEHFAGFGNLGAAKFVVLNVAGMTRMTSFGVRQWLKGMDALPKTISALYMLGCPTFFVDQLNMVLNFGGNAQILTAVAPFTCPGCGVESGETIDVLADRLVLAKSSAPEKECTRCNGKLEFDETPESYFSFVSKYAASGIEPAVAQVLAQQGLYTAADLSAEKPPRIIKLVHGAVTYFRIIGTISSMFRARPLLVGAEGEVVIDLAEVERFDPLGQREWRRLVKTLAAQVPGVTLVDVGESFLTYAGDSLSLARNVAVWSVLVPHKCADCGRMSAVSEPLQGPQWPPQFPDHVCSTCGGTTSNVLVTDVIAPLQKASTSTPPASAKLIAQRDEVLSRALTDANVAQAGQNATAQLSADDAILGKYRIVKRLSAGGMAEVFLAKQVGIGGFEKPVALKRIQRQLLETRHLAVDMFLNEAKIAGRLMHPNIVQVLDVGEVGGALYLAMEFVRGKDLRDVVKKLRATHTSMPLGIACFVVREVAQALHHAYWSTDMAGNQLSVVHRDVSPHNIIVSFDGGVKLLDFGVAMSAVTEQADVIVGKWQYMSPEHTTNQAVDHRSDLFSLGVIMYLLCAGSMPFKGSDLKDIVKKIRAGEYTPLHEVAPEVPEDIASLVARLLASNPAHRPQTGAEVATAITNVTRTYGIDCAGTNVASFMAKLFADETAEAPVEIEIVPAPRSSSLRLESSLATRVDSRFAATELQPGAIEDSKSIEPMSASPQPLSPGSLPPGVFPSGSFTNRSAPPDVSMSLAARRSQHDFTAPVVAVKWWKSLKSIAVIALIVVLGIIAYFVVQPH